MLQTKTKYNSSQCIELVRSGEDYFLRLERIINEAAVEIYIQIYIFENDATGKRIITALINALQRNVKVYLLLDGFGSLSFPHKTVSKLKKEGCSIRFFSPLLTASPFYIGRRLHEKVIVADEKVALIGGINIAYRYQGSKNEKPWLDYAVEINSNIIKDLQSQCKANYLKKINALRKKIPAFIETDKSTTIRILQNDWLNRKNEISKAYIKSINNAKESIIIVGSYFLPGKRITKALLKAAKRKVTIKLLLSGVSDVPLTRNATCYLYSKLLRHHIELYEWNESILHGKAMVVDQYWSTIGSFNLNNLSSFASVEMNVGIESTNFAKIFEKELQTTLLQCQQITLDSFQTKNTIGTKIKNAVSYYITRGLEILMTYLPYKRFNHS
jgi:cardiolipin synthase